MKNVRRRPTGRAVGLLLLALVLIAAGCGSSSKSSSSATTVPKGVRPDTQLVFGGPPECLERPLCLGTTEKSLYGLDFKEVKKLDAGGPVTTKALSDGTIGVGLLFTGSSVIKDDFVLLKDDKGLQPSDNPTAVIRSDKASPDVVRIIDSVNAKLDTAAYNAMALSVFNDKLDPKVVAAKFLKDNGLDTAGTTGKGKSLKVGSKDFAGAQLLSQAYGQALAANGYDVSYKDNIGTTEVVYPLVRSGEIDFYGEYTGTFLTFLKGTPSADSKTTYDALTAKLQGSGVQATTPASAQDVNGFYVTKKTADKWSLVNVSDLTKKTS
jgi:glycine betaine/choline ABC-type transport system substrate-binding protein